MIYTKFHIVFLLIIIIVANFTAKFKSKEFFIASLCLFLVIPFLSFLVLHNLSNQNLEDLTSQDNVIVVLGAGIRNDTPTEILKRRLETGKEIYDQTKSKIIVTGDNSQEYHNEPRVMKNYLIRLGVPSSDITEDFGGRRTMDSCYRVKNFFNASKIVIVSQVFHLPRAKFLCESVGLSVQTQAAQDISNSTVIWGYLREIPASWPALFDSIYFKPQVGSDGSETIG
jgi:vancomycin permeability regulator SanA